MKTITLLALALAGACYARHAHPNEKDRIALLEPAPVVETAKPSTGNLFVAASSQSVLEFSPVLNLSIRAGTGQIVINLKTGQVDLPKGMTLPDAAVAFWLRVAQAFPECRQAMLTGDPTPLTTEWRPNGMVFMSAGTTGGKTYELGLRSDGVVVWREVKP